MPESVKGKHTQICEELDQWRSWGCVHCLAHESSSSADQYWACSHFNSGKVFNLLSWPSQCYKQADGKPNVKDFNSGRLENHTTFNSAKSLAALQVNINDRSDQRQSSHGEKPGAELVDVREGGVRYRDKLRKYVVEYRPSRFKWKLWMGTYSSQQDGRRAFDCAMFYAGQGKGNYYFHDSPELFQKLGPLERLFSQVSKDARDKPFNIELKKRAKEIIKQTARMGDMRMNCCTTYKHVGSAIPEVVACASIQVSQSAATESAGPKPGDEPAAELAYELKEPEPKESDPAFKDLEPLFQLRQPLYRDDQVCTGGLLHPESSGSPFFVPGLHSLDTPKFVLDSESDESWNDLPLWIYEIIFSSSSSSMETI